jgi:hypothetical protein
MTKTTKQKPRNDAALAAKREETRQKEEYEVLPLSMRLQLQGYRTADPYRWDK